jgi:hypothetical protein
MGMLRKLLLPLGVITRLQIAAEPGHVHNGGIRWIPHLARQCSATLHTATIHCGLPVKLCLKLTMLL